jgi:hypothetical protein
MSPRKQNSEFPDVGESTKEPAKLPEEALVRCKRCGIERHGWTGNGGKGYAIRNELFCCEGCGNGDGCFCVSEQARHTNLSQDRERTKAFPPRPSQG